MQKRKYTQIRTRAAGLAPVFILGVGVGHGPERDEAVLVQQAVFARSKANEGHVVTIALFKHLGPKGND